ncbi:MAG: alpha-L-rhamnosidase, partial [Candidatus Glassbacteria bacterium RIFCSPLOWO2_12_FULL_58_11]
GNKLTIAPNTQATLLLDQSYLNTAYPELTVSGGRGAQISLTYAEALLDSRGIKANRDSVTGMHIFGYADHFRPDGGDNRQFSSLWFRTFRYLELKAETAGQPLVIEALTSRAVGYPFERRAVFNSDDPTMTKIWDVGWRTARLCAGETYFDCPYYEQLNYAGDTRIQALISLYASGDDRLMRKAITQFDDSRIPDGLTQSRYPSNVTQIIPPYSLFWIAMVHDYWMHRDDPEFVRSFLPGIQGVLGWFERHLTKNGLLGHLPWWNFVDWANEYDSGVCPGADEGETSVISLQYVYALQYAEELFRSFGRIAEADHYRELAAGISQAVKARCWNEQRGLYAETPEQKQFSQHANIMAILTGLVPRLEQPGMLEKILSEPDLIQCTFYYRFYLTRALKKAGLADRYLETLAPWEKMLEIGLTTFAENPEPTRSDCHAWSASPVYDFLATVCGIEPAEPGFKKVRIEPHPGGLKQVRGSLPHPLGPVELALTQAGGGGYSAEITLPAGLSGELVWRGKSTELHPGKQQILLAD